MHSRDRLTGMICKCMECAHARYKRLEKMADRERPEEMARVRHLEASAERDKEEAEARLRAARHEKSDLIGSLRAQAIAEEEAKT